jgi:hypothetical protein
MLQLLPINQKSYEHQIGGSSSAIEVAGYDEVNSDFYVKWYRNSIVYQYVNVPISVFREFKRAEFIGKYMLRFQGTKHGKMFKRHNSFEWNFKQTVEETVEGGKTKRYSIEEVTPTNEEIITSPMKKVNISKVEDPEEIKDENSTFSERVQVKMEKENVEKVVETPTPEKEVAVKTTDESSGITVAAEVAAQ